jgi:uncharacterized protein with ATP-grasp and redox domains
MTKPKLPIPQPLRGIDPDSFAYYTVTVRLPNIIQHVLIENDFSQPIVRQLKTLMEEIPSAPIRHLNDSGAPDASQWAEYLEPYLGLNWLQIPWFLAETYLYRRILEATGYFEPGEGYHVDPFALQKQRGLDTTQESIANLSLQLNSWVKQPDKMFNFFASILMIGLWGNQADLSLWPAGNHEQPKQTDLQTLHSDILINDTGAIIDYLAGRMNKLPRIDFIADNAGYELVCDLALADFCLSSSLASTVVLHLKSHPTFVSDAIIKDVEQTIQFLAKNLQPDIKNFGQRLQSYLETNRLQLQDDLFWTSPLSFWEMPEHVRQKLVQSNLLISKGDANYRRLLGDRHWPYTTPFADIVSYLPAPLVALRTLKSEVGAGFEPEQVKFLTEQDPHWLTNGKRGVIQFVNCPHSYEM